MNWMTKTKGITILLRSGTAPRPPPGRQKKEDCIDQGLGVGQKIELCLKDILVISQHNSLHSSTLTYFEICFYPPPTFGAGSPGCSSFGDQKGMLFLHAVRRN